MREVVADARRLQLPLIIDGSGLNFIAETPKLLHGYSNCILTPNIAEFGRLAKPVGLALPGKIGVQWQQQVRCFRGVGTQNSKQNRQPCNYKEKMVDY
jgi:NAD(P)H-hydrate repair Nnr-like enzyme with NAD(P)H-hydrate dehydratase domain